MWPELSSALPWLLTGALCLQPRVWLIFSHNVLLSTQYCHQYCFSYPGWKVDSTLSSLDYPYSRGSPHGQHLKGQFWEQYRPPILTELDMGWCPGQRCWLILPEPQAPLSAIGTPTIHPNSCRFWD